MRRIAAVGALVGVVAMVSGCWAFGQVTGQLPDATYDVNVVPGEPTFAPGPSLWAAQTVVIVRLGDPGGAGLTADEVAATTAVIEARLAALGEAASVVTIPDDRLRIDVADASDADAVRRVATAPGNLEFVGVPDAYADSIADGQPLPSGMVAVPLFGTEGVAAARLDTAQTGQTAIDIDLRPAAAQAFDDYAKAHLGERFAIVLDGVVIAAPTLNATSFNGHAQITGTFDVQGAQELVAILTGGVLPVTAEVLTVCPATQECAAPGPSASPATSG